MEDINKHTLKKEPVIKKRTVKKGGEKKRMNKKM